MFPLAIVLLPAERTALHIFEPRYKELIGECLLDDREFGIVFTDGVRLSEVGTQASIVEVLERFEDGRLNIVVEGNERFRVLDLNEERSFLSAQTEDYADEPEIPDADAAEQALDDYRRVVELGELELSEPVPDDRGLAFHLAARIALPPAAKQELLEMRSENRRLERVREFLAAAAEAARVRTVQRLASTNGHIKQA